MAKAKTKKPKGTTPKVSTKRKTVKQKKASETVLAVYKGLHPHLGNQHTLTMLGDGTVKIEREAIETTFISRHDGKEVTHRKEFAVLVEPVDNHRWLIDFFKTGQ